MKPQNKRELEGESGPRSVSVIITCMLPPGIQLHPVCLGFCVVLL